jgi:hypothetical protein
MLSTIRRAMELRRLRMPRDEIRAILEADDPVVVHRYFELHQERLEEWLADQRRNLTSLERAMTHPVG